MCYASGRGLLPIFVFRYRDLDKSEANVDKIILLVRTTTIKMRRLTKINSVGVDQLFNRERSSGEAKHSQNPLHVLNIFICNTAQDSLIRSI